MISMLANPKAHEQFFLLLFRRVRPITHCTQPKLGPLLEQPDFIPSYRMASSMVPPAHVPSQFLCCQELATLSSARSFCPQCRMHLESGNGIIMIIPPRRRAVAASDVGIGDARR